MERRSNTPYEGSKFHNKLALVAAVGLCLAAMHSAIRADEQNTNPTAERLVEEARQAELDCDNSRFFALLRQAVQIAPDYELARWQLGQVKVGGEWLTVEEAQRRAAANPRQAEYRELRKAHGETPQGQLELARWCRKNNLQQESLFHWASVLAVAPMNEEAQRAVGRRWRNGRLLTPDEIAEEKRQLREARQASKEWAPKVAKWKRAISGRDAAKREAALEEIRSLATTDVIPSVEEHTLGRDARDKDQAEACRLTSLAFVQALAKMPAIAATESLVRYAVFSPVTDVRKAAIENLNPRPQHDYVPLLLSGLAMPIESSFQVKTEADGSVHYVHSLYREGAESDISYDVRRSAMQHDLRGRRYIRDTYTNKTKIGPRSESPALVAARKAVVASRYQNRFGSVALAAERQVSEANGAILAMNDLITPVLGATTGKDLGQSPTAWWNWWREHNEYYASDDKPVEQYYNSDTESYYYGAPSYSEVSSAPLPPPPPPGRYSCFVKGTTVWAKPGKQPIESLELGDLVLSQNVNTGELTYKPVISITIRPPSKTLQLSVGNEKLRTTLGHPLWVAGVGWRMAKELGDGAILHAVTGAQRVSAVEPAGEEAAYNLVVADFNTYFVGESGVLVHDNTPRRPTQATVPGMAAE